MAWNSRTLGAFALSTAVAATVTTAALRSPNDRVEPATAHQVTETATLDVHDAQRALLRAELTLRRYDDIQTNLFADADPSIHEAIGGVRTELDSTWQRISNDTRTNITSCQDALASNHTPDVEDTINTAMRIERELASAWTLYAEVTDATFAKFVEVETAPQDDTLFASLDAAMIAAAEETNLAYDPALADMARESTTQLAMALSDGARAAAAISSDVAATFTGALLNAQIAIHDISTEYAMNTPRVQTITNADVDAMLASGGASNITANVPSIEAVSPTSEYVLPIERLRFAAQAEGAQAGGGGAAAPAAEAAPAPAPQPAAPAAPIRSVQATTSAGTMGVNQQVYDPNDPLGQRADVRFREMELRNAVDILAKKAEMNVVGGPALTGTINANMTNVPLGRALQIILEVHGLGMIREGNILRIVTLEEALATHRITQIVRLNKANATDIATTLQNTLAGGVNSDLVSISPNETTNIILIAGPPARVSELVNLAEQLDVSEPVLPTFTEAIPLNYAEPQEILPVIENMLTTDVGSATPDPRTRHIIVNDVPAVLEQVREVMLSLDRPVKQVAIESMVVDVVLRDETDIGTNILFNLINNVNARGVQVGDFGGASAGFGQTANNLANYNIRGNGTIPGPNGLPDTAVANPVGSPGTLAIQLLNNNYNLTAAVNLAVMSQDAKLLANPMIVTTENTPATVSIRQEFPFQELTQTQEGGNLATTSFKDIGTTLEVTPRVTNDRNIIVDLMATESTVSGLSATGVPIEEAREAQGTFMVHDGQTVFIGGLRNSQEGVNINKVPVLGDVPILGTLFRNTNNLKTNTELMIFLTCHILGDQLPELTPSEKEAYDELGSEPFVPDTAGQTLRTIVHPNEMRDPAWKWRKSGK